MLYLEKIPYLKVYKQKITMPIDTKRSSLYSMIFLNSPDVDSSILTMKHPMIDTRSKYLSYYIERLYKEKIGVKTVNLRNIKEQEIIYDKITEELKGFKCYKTFNSINSRNLYYDMSTYNNIFFTNNKIKNMKQKAYTYLSYMTKTIRQPKFDVYTHQTMVIDLDRWDKIDNPLMYMLIAYRYNYEALQSIGDIDILLCTNSAVIKFNPSKLTEKLYSTFKREINKVVKLSKSDMEKLSKELDDEKVPEVPKNSKSVSEEKPKAISSKPKEEDKPDKGLVKDIVPDIPESEEDIDLNDKELLSDLIDAKMKEETTTKSAASIKRDKELREKQKQIKIDNMTIEDYRKLKVDDVKIEDIDISNSVSTINPNATDIKFTNFEKTYNDNLMKKDTIDIITQLNNKSIPVYIKDIDIVDSSDELNYKDTYTITMEDENRVRHTIKVDMPKFVDDKFLYLGGNKKIIIKQLFSLPIVKTDSNEVVITTNYNKTFISRTGLKVSPKIERLKRTLANDKSDMILVRGNNATDNNSFKTNLEYDELALLYTNIKSKNIDICLNQKSIQDRLKVNVEENKFCIGFYKDGTPILCDFETEKIGDFDLVDFIVANSSDKFKALYEETTPGGKRYMYTKSKIMNKNIPLVILLGYWEGLTKVMNKANIKHYFSDKRSKITDNQEAIQFEDGYLVYDKYPIENSLLMNALQTVHTKAYKYEDFDEKDVYLDIFENFYNTRYLANALDSFYEFMIDPITEEILDTMNYPTDIVSLFLFANSLLADNASMDENAMDQFRVRSNEVVNAILHKKIADAYGIYRKSASNNNPTKISIPQDAVIKELLTSKTVEEFSTLNPIYEADKTRAITRKGFNGMNLDDAYTEDKRMYNKSMLGVMGVSTSPDYNVGVVRKLSLEPNIKNARGFIDNPDNVKDIKDSNMFSPSELLTPNAVVHDDSVRTAIKNAVAS